MATCIRVRMYRTGFGDCFLLSMRSSVPARHVLVDFGAHMHGEIVTMDAIMENIEFETGKRLELIVATHAHRDHISGFDKFAARFAEFQIGEVWMPWTDNPNNKNAASLQMRHLALYETLERHLRIALKATEENAKYAAALEALYNLKGNEKATMELRRAFGTSARVRYLSATIVLSNVGEAKGLSAEILGPPDDKSFLARITPPANQRFIAAVDGAASAVHPFPSLEIKVDDSDYEAIRNDGQPLLSTDQLNRLHDLAELPADRLALALDNARNNTSLVILFRFKDKSLLFPGDAQWGSWQSWIGTDHACKLLGELDFLKVAHHGSENATPVDVVKALRSAGLAAMVPTQEKPFPTIPRPPLLSELAKRCAGGVAVRSDWVEIPSAPIGPKPTSRRI